MKRGVVLMVRVNSTKNKNKYHAFFFKVQHW